MACPPAPRSLLLAVTDPVSLRLIEGLPAHLRDVGWEVTVVAGGESVAGVDEVVPMVRNPSPFFDLVALVRWVRLLRRRRQDVVIASTPKAGLLGMAASWLLRVDRRVYLLRGLRLETETGLRRAILLAMERLAAGFATDVLCVSHSLRDEYVRLSLGKPAKAVVLGSGSSNGVDTERFRPTSCTDRADGRTSFGLDQGVPVVGYIGRITPAKGLDTLVEAAVIANRTALFQLLLVGRSEKDGYASQLVQKLQAAEVPHRVNDHVSDVGSAYAAMDVFCLPSLREGFPNVVLEAAACGLPVITTTATGCRDAVIPGRTGWLVREGDSDQLALAICSAVKDLDQCRVLGSLGREWVTQEFARARVWSLLDNYLAGPTRLSGQELTLRRGLHK